MAPLVFGIPFLAFKVAANARIMDSANGIYGATGNVTGSIAPVASKKIRAIFDGRATSATLPYLVWGDKAKSRAVGGGMAVFHQATVEPRMTLHLYSGQMNSTDEVDELCDRLNRLFDQQPLSLVGYTAIVVTMNVVSVIPDPVGQHAIIQFEPVTRVQQV